MAGNGPLRGSLRAGRGTILLLLALVEGQAGQDKDARSGRHGGGSAGRRRENHERCRADSVDCY